LINLFKKKVKRPEVESTKKVNEDYIELTDSPADKKSSGTLMVYYCVLNEFGDIKTVLDLLRGTNAMCIIKIKPLKDKDINELKRAITKIKRVCEVMEGDVVGMDEDYLIAHPKNIKICKGK